jgi:16S rRNA (guanine966-N2)-methyltransferase
MRIIAGSAGGIPLRVPGHDLRPTMDMVRGAVFSALGDAVVGARVLDLFAGGGGFGIEALSRGAAEVVFVDNHQRAIEAIRFNLAKARLEGSVVRSDVFRYLSSDPMPFQLIFADPPYKKRPADRDYIRDLMAHPSMLNIADPASIVVLERMPSNSEPKFPGWQITRAKRYGGTEIIFCRVAASSRSS